jgi:hypothetical protein
MAGVAGPLMRRSRPMAARFLLGLTAGHLIVGVLLSFAVFGLGLLITSVVPSAIRMTILVLVTVALAMADALNRTPHTSRQVPVRLYGQLSPGFLGFSWGFDLGLLITTNKTNSLIWVALAGTLLTAPFAAPLLMIEVALLSSAAIFVRSLKDSYHPSQVPSRHTLSLAGIRRTSAALLGVVAVSLVLSGGGA